MKFIEANFFKIKLVILENSTLTANNNTIT